MERLNELIGAKEVNRDILELYSYRDLNKANARVIQHQELNDKPTKRTLKLKILNSVIAQKIETSKLT